MLFQFRLRPIDDIAPWGPEPHLHWFGLTDGWYWLDTGEAELFRYDQALVETFRHETWAAHTPSELLPYVDYQVVRLWEDVLDILPEMLEPIPPRLAHLLEPGGPWAVWEQRATTATEAAPSKSEMWCPLDAACGWWWRRHLDSLYLVSGPSIWFWCDGADIHIRWDNRKRILDDLPAWTARIGQCVLPIKAFLDEVRSFDSRFIQAMEQRVMEVQEGWARPEIAINVGALVQEQQVRTQWLNRRLDAASKRQPTDWDAVYQAIARIEELPAFDQAVAIRLAH